jgi:cardiolipin synthase A/B
LRRDHRKVLVVDGQVGFVSGLCVADDWRGDPKRGIEPWRDTRVKLRGPVVEDLAKAFADTWAEAGPPLPAISRFEPQPNAVAGGVTARVIAGQPGTLSTYRVDQFVASAARRLLWLTDAYFVATNAHIEILRNPSPPLDERGRAAAQKVYSQEGPQPTPGRALCPLQA